MSPTSTVTDLCGKTYLITGASSGIGFETSMLIASLGGKVVLVARDSQRLERATQKLPGGNHAFVCRDLSTDQASIPEWMRELGSAHGPFHGAAHCAGVHITAPLMVTSPDDYGEVHTLNVVAAAMLAKGFRQKAVRASETSLVLLSSVSALAGAPGAAAYASSKGAISALVRSLAIELARERIRVNCVAPGFVRTEMTESFGTYLTPQQLADIDARHPLGVGSPQDVACSIVFLLSAWSRWITGTTLVVDGGYLAQ